MTDTEVKMIKAELNQLAAKDKFSNIHECTLKLINFYEAIILSNQMEIEELKKNALVWHKVACFDNPDENGWITNDVPAYDNSEYLVRNKRGHYSIQELMEVDTGIVFEDCKWEDVDAWAELPKESKYNEECEEDCVVHRSATHNACVFCSSFRNSPYYRESLLGKSDEEIEAIRKEVNEEL